MACVSRNLQQTERFTLKYHLLNLVSTLAALATRIADRLAVLAARSAESTDLIAVKANRAAFDCGVQIVQAETDVAEEAQRVAYTAYQSARSNFQDKAWVGVEKLAKLRAKHALAESSVLQC